MSCTHYRSRWAVLAAKSTHHAPRPADSFFVALPPNPSAVLRPRRPLRHLHRPRRIAVTRPTAGSEGTTLRITARGREAQGLLPDQPGLAGRHPEMDPAPIHVQDRLPGIGDLSTVPICQSRLLSARGPISVGASPTGRELIPSSRPDILPHGQPPSPTARQTRRATNCRYPMSGVRAPSRSSHPAKLKPDCHSVARFAPCRLAYNRRQSMAALFAFGVS